MEGEVEHLSKTVSLAAAILQATAAFHNFLVKPLLASEIMKHVLYADEI